MKDGRVAVIGAGITGLAAAWEFASATPLHVTVFETSERPGGRIGGTGFAGLDMIDSGADAFLARVPDATQLAAEVGLADELVSPEPVHAAVWYDSLHRIPDGLLLGVPGQLAPLARTRLLSWRGKARAALEPFLPRTSIDDDSIGQLIRARFGDEVQERLVDALVGSIYATDTDRFSLREVPQLYELASRERSLLLAARPSRRRWDGHRGHRPDLRRSARWVGPAGGRHGRCDHARGRRHPHIDTGRPDRAARRRVGRRWRPVRCRRRRRARPGRCRTPRRLLARDA